MSAVRIGIIASVVVGVLAILVYLILRNPAMPFHLRPYFKSDAEYNAFVKKQQQLAAQSKEYFADGTTPTAGDVIRLYRELGHDAVASAIEERLQPCFRLMAREPDGKPSGSRIGGSPSLGTPDLWPKRKGKSLAFIAQVDLAERPTDNRPVDLPDSGVLYFFYDSEQSTWGFDPKDKGSWAVIYSENAEGSPSKIDFPEDLPDHARYASVPVSLIAESAIPDLSRILSELSLSEEQKYQVTDIYGQFIEHGGPRHQLLGHAAAIQGDMQLECQLVSHGLYCGDSTGYNDLRAKPLEAGASRWQLLLQIDTDEETGMMWGDAGRLYFWITQDDLREKRFENSWMILQCY